MKFARNFVAADKRLHDLKRFDCGKPEMDEFLKRFSVKHNRLGLSRTFVLPIINDSEKANIAAYYTLASSTLTRTDIPTTQSLPRYPIPVVILGRLAVNQAFQGQGLGAKTLVHALRQSVQLCKSGLPAYGLVLDVLDQDALAFYQSFEIFQPFTADPMRLFVPMRTLEQI